MSGVFGVIVSGRTPIEVVPVSDAEFTCEIVQADSIDMVEVFLSGSKPFPDGIGGSVYIRWPTQDGGNWHYLGFICTQKPRAIFKVSQLHKSVGSHVNIFNTRQQLQMYSTGCAQIGIITEKLILSQARQEAEYSKKQTMEPPTWNKKKLMKRKAKNLIVEEMKLLTVSSSYPRFRFKNLASDNLGMTYDIEYDHPLLGRIKYVMRYDREYPKKMPIVSLSNYRDFPELPPRLLHRDSSKLIVPEDVVHTVESILHYIEGQLKRDNSQKPPETPASRLLPPPFSIKPSPLTTSQSGKRASRSPIIIVPSAMNKMINLYNARDILHNLGFVTVEHCEKDANKKPVDLAIQRQKNGVTYNIRVIDNAEKLAKEDWEHVIAVFVTGSQWQFKGWKWNGKPTEIFTHIPAFYFHFDADKPCAQVMQWNVHRIPVSAQKRHMDEARFSQMWETIENFLLKNKPHLIPELMPPIIIVPSAMDTMINLYNARDILQNLGFVTVEQRKKDANKKPVDLAIQRQKNGVTYNIRVIDNAEKLAKEDWDHVIAVFVTGSQWQFKGWKWNGKPTEIFTHIPAFYFHFDADKPCPQVMQWNVHRIPVSAQKRHMDEARFSQMWETIENVVRKNKPHLTQRMGL